LRDRNAAVRYGSRTLRSPRKFRCFQEHALRCESGPFGVRNDFVLILKAFSQDSPLQPHYDPKQNFIRQTSTETICLPDAACLKVTVS
jgi:hypothetical protein